MVLRGYDRHQVDAYVASAQDEIHALRQQRNGLESDLGRAVNRTAELTALLDELWQRRGSDHTFPTAPAPMGEPESYSPAGPITDKLVRLARREAALVRATAAREAANIIDAAREQAALHRGDAEQPVDRPPDDVSRQAPHRVPSGDDTPTPQEDERSPGR